MQKTSKKTIELFLNPYSVVKEFDLKPGMSVADFGSGSGHFSLAVANIVGKDGFVYAIDIRSDVLDVLRGHIKLGGLFQIRIIQADLEKSHGSKLQDESQDRVLCLNILHQVRKRDLVIKEACRVLKDNGNLIVIDWVKDVPFGPAEKISKNIVKKLANTAGFGDSKEFDAGISHYGLIFTKK